MLHLNLKENKSHFFFDNMTLDVTYFGKVLIVLFFFLFFAVIHPRVAIAKERIRNVKVGIVSKEILVSADLTGGFGRKIVNDIQNGIPKDFYYYILLKRRENIWFDEEVDSMTIRYTVKYDTLKKNYLVIQSDGDKVVEKHAADLEEMKKIVSRIDSIRFSSTHLLKKRHRYYVSVKSQMKAAELPFYLDYFLFFIPFLELDTPWADSALVSLAIDQ